MIRALLPLPLLLLAAAAEVPFDASPESFADPAACRARLVTLVDDAAAGGYDAVEGPYQVGGGDVRIHMVRAEGAGHRITEHRCVAEKLSARSWSHSMEDDQPEFTVESVARNAPWLKKDRPEQ
jgi:hypothetical protein